MKISAQRIGDGPIIRPHMDNRMGENVNGPSLIRVPDWLPNPLGKYYLYFAHHDGKYIRLAYADHLRGPWKTVESGVLPLEDSLFRGHIASPDVIVDPATKTLRLYYHGADEPTANNAPQVTRVATSSDGISFQAHPEVLGQPYMRVFAYQGWHYAITMPGVFYRSKDGLTNFEEGPNPFEPHVRHVAVLLREHRIIVFYTRVGDMPERILQTEIELVEDWCNWRPGPSSEVIAPEREYEGGHLALRPSVRGMAREPMRELRDPAIFEYEGETYLLYSVAGEHGIALAQLTISAS